MSAALKRGRDNELKVLASSGKVFADLGLPHSEEDMLKVEIAQAIVVTLRRKGLTQAAAGHIIGVDQAKVSALVRGRLRGFSIERLVGFLRALGRDVDVKISKEHAGQGKIRVQRAA